MEDKDYKQKFVPETYGFPELKTDMCWVKKTLSNHLAHHEKRDYMWFTAMIGLVITLVAVIVKG